MSATDVTPRMEALTDAVRHRQQSSARAARNIMAWLQSQVALTKSEPGTTPANISVYRTGHQRSASDARQSLGVGPTRGRLRERTLGSGKPCGHACHCGTCPWCQRAQLARWEAQLAQATSERGH